MRWAADSLRRLLALAGLRLSRLPQPLLDRPDLQLSLGLRHLVAEHAAQSSRPLFLVQIGAHDGRSGDCVHELVRRHGMRAILVEPQPNVFQELGRNYADYPNAELRNVAIADRVGRRILYSVAPAPDLPFWASQLASFHKGSLLRHRQTIPDLEQRIVEQQVDCITFDQLLDRAPRRVDVLMVDTEGYDAEVMRLFHETGRTAAVLCFEHMYLGRKELDDCYRLLLGLGYRLAMVGPDTLGLGRED